jgi:hypothetical protein
VSGLWSAILIAVSTAIACATGAMPRRARIRSHGRAKVLAATLAVVMAAAMQPVAQAAPAAPEQRRIDILLDAVAADRESRFVRAGVEYTGADAARFLRAKLQAQGDGVRTAEDFVERIASRSSTTGRPYRVCRSAGGCVDAGEHLRALLLRVAARP